MQERIITTMKQKNCFIKLREHYTKNSTKNGKMVEIPINEGEMFLLPAKIPHSPIRSENSIGLVIERKREDHHKDGLLWYSDREKCFV